MMLFDVFVTLFVELFVVLVDVLLDVLLDVLELLLFCRRSGLLLLRGSDILSFVVDSNLSCFQVSSAFLSERGPFLYKK